jgi:hypothetical protein
MDARVGVRRFGVCALSYSVRWRTDSGCVANAACDGAGPSHARATKAKSFQRIRAVPGLARIALRVGQCLLNMSLPLPERDANSLMSLGSR